MQTKSTGIKNYLAADWHYLFRLVVVIAVYILAARFGLSLAYSTKQVSTVWPPTGIALAMLLILGYRYWPAIFIGAFVVNVFTNESALIALGIAIGNTLEAAAGAYLLQRIAKLNRRLDRTSDVGWLVVAVAVASGVSATIGTFCLAAGHLVTWQHYRSVWLLWWIGDLMGGLVFAPLILALADYAKVRRLQQRLLEFGFIVAAAFAASVLAFWSPPVGRLAISPLSYLVFPFIVWAAMRIGPIGSTVVTLIISLVAISSTINNLGPFAGTGSVEQNLVLLQCFIFVVVLTSLFLSAAVGERNRVQEALQRKTVELENARDDLEQANQRITDVLAGILDDQSSRRSVGVRSDKT